MNKRIIVIKGPAHWVFSVLRAMAGKRWIGRRSLMCEGDYDRAKFEAMFGPRRPRDEGLLVKYSGVLEGKESNNAGHTET